MDKKLSILNILLLFIAGILIAWIIRIWVGPDFPSRLDGDSLIGSPKSLQEFSANRKTYPQTLISKIIAQNLFRKERVEFKVDSPKAKAETKVALPPPEITVKGILLLSSTKVAVLAGHYFIPGPNQKPERKAIKKKGYSLNEYIGDFQIVRIEKHLVELKGPQDTTLTLYLKHQSKTPIQREANLLYYKKKKKNPEVPVQKSAQSRLNPPPETLNSKASTQNTPNPLTSSNISVPPNDPIPQPTPPTSISGAFQGRISQPVGSICGARTTRPPPRAHVSGR